MKKSYAFILAGAIVICLVLSAGCTGISGTSQSAGQVVPQPTAAAISATPLHYAEVNGVTLGYREFGSGEPVLLIEGFGATMDTWNATFIGILASKYHVYTYDHRGMGHSTNNNATPTISQYADDAAGLIQASGFPNA
jgi:hypothetical protein